MLEELQCADLSLYLRHHKQIQIRQFQFRGLNKTAKKMTTTRAFQSAETEELWIRKWNKSIIRARFHEGSTDRVTNSRSSRRSSVKNQRRTRDGKPASEAKRNVPCVYFAKCCGGQWSMQISVIDRRKQRIRDDPKPEVERNQRSKRK